MLSSSGDREENINPKEVSKKVKDAAKILLSQDVLIVFQRVKCARKDRGNGLLLYCLQSHYLNESVTIYV